MSDEFDLSGFGEEWLCPDIPFIEIYRDPYYYKSGQQLIALVNRCDVATQIDRENGLQSYTDVECVSDLTSDWAS